MTPDATLPDFGRMTVPPFFGWQHILIGVVLVLLVGAVAFLLLATGKAESSRTEWQAWLDARASGYQDVEGDPQPAGEVSPRPRRPAAGAPASGSDHGA